MQEVCICAKLENNNEGDAKAGDCSKNSNEKDVKHSHGLGGKHLPGAIHPKQQKY